MLNYDEDDHIGLFSYNTGYTAKSPPPPPDLHDDVTDDYINTTCNDEYKKPDYDSEDSHRPDIHRQDSYRQNNNHKDETVELIVNTK